MKIIKAALSVLLVVFTAMAFADTSPPVASATPKAAAPMSPEETIKQLVEKHLGGVKVDSVNKTNFSGLYEMRVGGEIMYTDAQAKYLIQGHVFDWETRKDYTEERLQEISKINFSELPLDLAVKMVKGNGKRVIAVFEDPNCGFCKKLRHTLSTMTDVTVYTFMYNILAEDSFVKSKNVWCTADRVKTWDDWMLNGKTPPEAAASCVTTPNDKVLALGKKLNITGTPAIFFVDGTRIPGFTDEQHLDEKWASIK